MDRQRCWKVAPQQELQITMATSSASPLLMLACQANRPLGTAVLSCRTMEDQPRDVLTIRLEKVYVCSYNHSHSVYSQSDASPLIDTISFTYTSIEMECGLLGTGELATVPVKAGWNAKENREI